MAICVKVCPVIVPDPFNEGLSPRRAAHKLYPQAVPNAYAIEKHGMSPCRDACPSGQRAQGYIALIREGRWHDALRVIKMDNPFPGICGRICNHRCETAPAIAGKAEQEFQPIIGQWVPPSGEIESALFALQAAIGGIMVGWVFGYWRGQKKRETME